MLSLILSVLTGFSPWGGFPNVELSPTSLELSLPSGGMAEASLLVRNTGNGFLQVWAIESSLPWVVATPASFGVPAHQSRTVSVRATATGITPGTYHGILSLSCNDPDTPDTTVPLSVLVTEPPGGAQWHGGFLWCLPPGPNPFRRVLSLSWGMARPAWVDVWVLDQAGRRIATLWSGPRGSGLSRLTWDGRDEWGSEVGPGVFLLELRCEGHHSTWPVVRLP